MTACECSEIHERRRVVLTGGPGAGKTALLELIRQSFCSHVKVLPEAAGVVFGGGFPREDDPACRRAAQRAIFYVQRELEAAGDSHNPAIVLCDRGTVDGLAYWPGPPEEFWSSLDTTLDEELGRYRCRHPSAHAGGGTRLQPPESPPNGVTSQRPPKSTRALHRRGHRIREGSSSSRRPTSSTRPLARSRSFAASCPGAVSGTSSRRFGTI